MNNGKDSPVLSVSCDWCGAAVGWRCRVGRRPKYLRHQERRGEVASEPHGARLRRYSSERAKESTGPGAGRQP